MSDSNPTNNSTNFGLAGFLNRQIQRTYNKVGDAVISAATPVGANDLSKLGETVTVYLPAKISGREEVQSGKGSTIGEPIDPKLNVPIATVGAVEEVREVKRAELPSVLLENPNAEFVDKDLGEQRYKVSDVFANKKKYDSLKNDSKFAESVYGKYTSYQDDKPDFLAVARGEGQNVGQTVGIVPATTAVWGKNSEEQNYVSGLLKTAGYNDEQVGALTRRNFVMPEIGTDVEAQTKLLQSDFTYDKVSNVIFNEKNESALDFAKGLVTNTGPVSAKGAVTGNTGSAEATSLKKENLEALSKIKDLKYDTEGKPILVDSAKFLLDEGKALFEKGNYLDAAFKGLQAGQALLNNSATTVDSANASEAEKQIKGKVGQAFNVLNFGASTAGAAFKQATIASSANSYKIFTGKFDQVKLNNLFEIDSTTTKANQAASSQLISNNGVKPKNFLEGVDNFVNNVRDGKGKLLDDKVATQQATTGVESGVKTALKQAGLQDEMKIGDNKLSLSKTAGQFTVGTLNFASDVALTMATAGAGSLGNYGKATGVLSKFRPGFATVATLNRDYSGMNTQQRFNAALGNYASSRLEMFLGDNLAKKGAETLMGNLARNQGNKLINKAISNPAWVSSIDDGLKEYLALAASPRGYKMLNATLEGLTEFGGGVASDFLVNSIQQGKTANVTTDDFAQNMLFGLTFAFAPNAFKSNGSMRGDLMSKITEGSKRTVHGDFSGAIDQISNYIDQSIPASNVPRAMVTEGRGRVVKGEFSPVSVQGRGFTATIPTREFVKEQIRRSLDFTAERENLDPKSVQANITVHSVIDPQYLAELEQSGKPGNAVVGEILNRLAQASPTNPYSAFNRIFMVEVTDIEGQKTDKILGLTYESDGTPKVVSEDEILEKSQMDKAKEYNSSIDDLTAFVNSDLYKKGDFQKATEFRYWAEKGQLKVAYLKDGIWRDMNQTFVIPPDTAEKTDLEGFYRTAGFDKLVKSVLAANTTKTAVLNDLLTTFKDKGIVGFIDKVATTLQVEEEVNTKGIEMKPTKEAVEAQEIELDYLAEILPSERQQQIYFLGKDLLGNLPDESQGKPTATQVQELVDQLPENQSLVLTIQELSALSNQEGQDMLTEAIDLYKENREILEGIIPVAELVKVDKITPKKGDVATTKQIKTIENRAVNKKDRTKEWLLKQASIVTGEEVTDLNTLTKNQATAVGNIVDKLPDVAKPAEIKPTLKLPKIINADERPKRLGIKLPFSKKDIPINFKEGAEVSDQFLSDKDKLAKEEVAAKAKEKEVKVLKLKAAPKVEAPKVEVLPPVEEVVVPTVAEAAPTVAENAIDEAPVSVTPTVENTVVAEVVPEVEVDQELDAGEVALAIPALNPELEYPQRTPVEVSKDLIYGAYQNPNAILLWDNLLTEEAATPMAVITAMHEAGHAFVDTLPVNQRNLFLKAFGEASGWAQGRLEDGQSLGSILPELEEVFVEYAARDVSAKEARGLWEIFKEFLANLWGTAKDFAQSGKWKWKVDNNREKAVVEAYEQYRNDFVDKYRIDTEKASPFVEQFEKWLTDTKPKEIDTADDLNPIGNSLENKVETLAGENRIVYDKVKFRMEMPDNAQKSKMEVAKRLAKSSNNALLIKSLLVNNPDSGILEILSRRNDLTSEAQTVVEEYKEGQRKARELKQKLKSLKENTSAQDGDFGLPESIRREALNVLENVKKNPIDLFRNENIMWEEFEHLIQEQESVSTRARLHGFILNNINKISQDTPQNLIEGTPDEYVIPTINDHLASIASNIIRHKETPVEYIKSYLLGNKSENQRYILEKTVENLSEAASWSGIDVDIRQEFLDGTREDFIELLEDVKNDDINKLFVKNVKDGFRLARVFSVSSTSEETKRMVVDAIKNKVSFGLDNIPQPEYLGASLLYDTSRTIQSITEMFPYLGPTAKVKLAVLLAQARVNGGIIYYSSTDFLNAVKESYPESVKPWFKDFLDGGLPALDIVEKKYNNEGKKEIDGFKDNVSESFSKKRYDSDILTAGGQPQFFIKRNTDLDGFKLSKENGFYFPSIAVTQNLSGNSGYGDISVFYSEEILDVPEGILFKEDGYTGTASQDRRLFILEYLLRAGKRSVGKVEGGQKELRRFLESERDFYTEKAYAEYKVYGILPFEFSKAVLVPKDMESQVREIVGDSAPVYTFDPQQEDSYATAVKKLTQDLEAKGEAVRFRDGGLASTQETASSEAEYDQSPISLLNQPSFIATEQYEALANQLRQRGIALELNPQERLQEIRDNQTVSDQITATEEDYNLPVTAFLERNNIEIAQLPEDMLNTMRETFRASTGIRDEFFYKWMGLTRVPKKASLLGEELKDKTLKEFKNNVYIVEPSGIKPSKAKNRQYIDALVPILQGYRTAQDPELPLEDFISELDLVGSLPEGLESVQEDIILEQRIQDTFNDNGFLGPYTQVIDETRILVTPEKQERYRNFLEEVRVILEGVESDWAELNKPVVSLSEALADTGLDVAKLPEGVRQELKDLWQSKSLGNNFEVAMQGDYILRNDVNRERFTEFLEEARGMLLDSEKEIERSILTISQNKIPLQIKAKFTQRALDEDSVDEEGERTVRATDTAVELFGERGQDLNALTPEELREVVQKMPAVEEGQNTITAGVRRVVQQINRFSEIEPGMVVTYTGKDVVANGNSLKEGDDLVIVGSFSDGIQAVKKADLDSYRENNNIRTSPVEDFVNRILNPEHLNLLGIDKVIVLEPEIATVGLTDTAEQTEIPSSILGNFEEVNVASEQRKRAEAEAKAAAKFLAENPIEVFNEEDTLTDEEYKQLEEGMDGMEFYSFSPELRNKLFKGGDKLLEQRLQQIEQGQIDLPVRVNLPELAIEQKKYLAELLRAGINRQIPLSENARNALVKVWLSGTIDRSTVVSLLREAGQDKTLFDRDSPERIAINETLYKAGVLGQKDGGAKASYVYVDPKASKPEVKTIDGQRLVKMYFPSVRQHVAFTEDFAANPANSLGWKPEEGYKRYVRSYNLQPTYASYSPALDRFSNINLAINQIIQNYAQPKPNNLIESITGLIRPNRGTNLSGDNLVERNFEQGSSYILGKSRVYARRYKSMENVQVQLLNDQGGEGGNTGQAVPEQSRNAYQNSKQRLREYSQRIQLAETPEAKAGYLEYLKTDNEEYKRFAAVLNEELDTIELEGGADYLEAQIALMQEWSLSPNIAKAINLMRAIDPVEMRSKLKNIRFIDPVHVEKGIRGTYSPRNQTITLSPFASSTTAIHELFHAKMTKDEEFTVAEMLSEDISIFVNTLLGTVLYETGSGEALLSTLYVYSERAIEVSVDFSKGPFAVYSAARLKKELKIKLLDAFDTITTVEDLSSKMQEFYDSLSYPGQLVFAQEYYAFFNELMISTGRPDMVNTGPVLRSSDLEASNPDLNSYLLETASPQETAPAKVPIRLGLKPKETAGWDNVLGIKEKVKKQTLSNEVSQLAREMDKMAKQGKSAPANTAPGARQEGSEPILSLATLSADATAIADYKSPKYDNFVRGWNNWVDKFGGTDLRVQLAGLEYLGIPAEIKEALTSLISFDSDYMELRLKKIKFLESDKIESSPGMVTGGFASHSAPEFTSPNTLTIALQDNPQKVASVIVHEAAHMLFDESVRQKIKGMMDENPLSLFEVMNKNNAGWPIFTDYLRTAYRRAILEVDRGNRQQLSKEVNRLQRLKAILGILTTSTPENSMENLREFYSLLGDYGLGSLETEFFAFTVQHAYTTKNWAMMKELLKPTTKRTPVQLSFGQAGDYLSLDASENQDLVSKNPELATYINKFFNEGGRNTVRNQPRVERSGWEKLIDEKNRKEKMKNQWEQKQFYNEILSLRGVLPGQTVPNAKTISPSSFMKLMKYDSTLSEDTPDAEILRTIAVGFDQVVRANNLNLNQQIAALRFLGVNSKVIDTLNSMIAIDPEYMATRLKQIRIEQGVEVAGSFEPSEGTLNVNVNPEFADSTAQTVVHELAHVLFDQGVRNHLKDQITTNPGGVFRTFARTLEDNSFKAALEYFNQYVPNFLAYAQFELGRGGRQQMAALNSLADRITKAKNPEELTPILSEFYNLLPDAAQGLVQTEVFAHIAEAAYKDNNWDMLGKLFRPKQQRSPVQLSFGTPGQFLSIDPGVVAAKEQQPPLKKVQEAEERAKTQEARERIIGAVTEEAKKSNIFSSPKEAIQDLFSLGLDSDEDIARKMEIAGINLRTEEIKAEGKAQAGLVSFENALTSITKDFNKETGLLSPNRAKTLEQMYDYFSILGEKNEKGEEAPLGQTYDQASGQFVPLFKYYRKAANELTIDAAARLIREGKEVTYLYRGGDVRVTYIGNTQVPERVYVNPEIANAEQLEKQINKGEYTGEVVEYRVKENVPEEYIKGIINRAQSGQISEKAQRYATRLRDVYTTLGRNLRGKGVNITFGNAFTPRQLELETKALRLERFESAVDTVTGFSNRSFAEQEAEGKLVKNLFNLTRRHIDRAKGMYTNKKLIKQLQAQSLLFTQEDLDSLANRRLELENLVSSEAIPDIQKVGMQKEIDQIKFFLGDTEQGNPGRGFLNSRIKVDDTDIYLPAALHRALYQKGVVEENTNLPVENEGGKWSQSVGSYVQNIADGINQNLSTSGTAYLADNMIRTAYAAVLDSPALLIENFLQPLLGASVQISSGIVADITSGNLTSGTIQGYWKTWEALSQRSLSAKGKYSSLAKFVLDGMGVDELAANYMFTQQRTIPKSNKIPLVRNAVNLVNTKFFGNPALSKLRMPFLAITQLTVGNFNKYLAASSLMTKLEREAKAQGRNLSSFDPAKSEDLDFFAEVKTRWEKEGGFVDNPANDPVVYQRLREIPVIGTMLTPKYTGWLFRGTNYLAKQTGNLTGIVGQFDRSKSPEEKRRLREAFGQTATSMMMLGMLTLILLAASEETDEELGAKDSSIRGTQRNTRAILPFGLDFGESFSVKDLARIAPTELGTFYDWIAKFEGARTLLGGDSEARANLLDNAINSLSEMVGISSSEGETNWNKVVGEFIGQQLVPARRTANDVAALFSKTDKKIESTDFDAILQGILGPDLSGALGLAVADRTVEIRDDKGKGQKVAVTKTMSQQFFERFLPGGRETIDLRGLYDGINRSEESLAKSRDKLDKDLSEGKITAEAYEKEMKKLETKQNKFNLDTVPYSGSSGARSIGSGGLRGGGQSLKSAISAAKKGANAKTPKKNKPVGIVSVRETGKSSGSSGGRQKEINLGTKVERYQRQRVRGGLDRDLTAGRISSSVRTNIRKPRTLGVKSVQMSQPKRLTLRRPRAGG